MIWLHEKQWCTREVTNHINRFGYKWKAGILDLIFVCGRFNSCSIAYCWEIWFIVTFWLFQLHSYSCSICAICVFKVFRASTDMIKQTTPAIQNQPKPKTLWKSFSCLFFPCCDIHTLSWDLQYSDSGFIYYSYTANFKGLRGNA